MTLLLAPMEGLLDFTLRDILTRVGGIDRCVSEFIRVTGTLLPERVFTRVVPELLHGSRTPVGVPVRAQLMGSDAVCLAENAGRLAGLRPAGIDLNFGCPAKVVNRHGGGAALLDDPALVHAIVSAVRRAVPRDVPVSAKMRLGVDDPSRALECALAISAAGADELVVHARTKLDGYRPPAYWEHIHEIQRSVPIPVVANGEIWTVADARRCRALSGCDTLMLGRGMVRDPGLALAIVADRRPLEAPHEGPGVPWEQLLPLMREFWALIESHIAPAARAGRLKQWLNYLRRRHPQAEVAYAAVRTINDPALVARHLNLTHRADEPRAAKNIEAREELLETLT
jgi:tRNA-dihydrouridine synthase C